MKDKEYLLSGASLNGADGIRLTQETNGNLVLYQDANILWESGEKETDGDGNYFTKVQGDGNFITRRGIPDKKKEVLWKTQKIGPSGDYFFAISTDLTKVSVNRGMPSNVLQEMWSESTLISDKLTSQPTSGLDPLPPSPSPPTKLPSPLTPSPSVRTTNSIELNALMVMTLGYTQASTFLSHHTMCSLYKNSTVTSYYVLVQMAIVMIFFGNRITMVRAPASSSSVIKKTGSLRFLSSYANASNLPPHRLNLSPCLLPRNKGKLLHSTAI